jgi:hypothetical protein
VRVGWGEKRREGNSIGGKVWGKAIEEKLVGGS